MKTSRAQTLRPLYGRRTSWRDVAVAWMLVSAVLFVALLALIYG